MKANTWKTILQIAIPSLQPSLLRSELPAAAFKGKKSKKVKKPSGMLSQRG